MTSLRVGPLPGGRVRPGLLAPVVVAIVLGILGMHGIGVHGVNLHDSMTHADASAPAVATMANHEPAAADSNDAHSAANGSLGGVAGHPAGHADGAGGMSGMVMLCVAMLSGAAVALLAVLVRRGRLPQVWAVLDPAGRVRAAMPAVLRVGTGPPAVWRFSVIRC